MDSINIGWKKQTVDEIQLKTIRKLSQRDSANRTPKKKVHFDSETPTVIPQAFEDIKSHQTERNQRHTNDFEDYGYTSSSKSIFTSE
jgi:hypothetical protein